MRLPKKIRDLRKVFAEAGCPGCVALITMIVEQEILGRRYGQIDVLPVNKELSHFPQGIQLGSKEKGISPIEYFVGLKGRLKSIRPEELKELDEVFGDYARRAPTMLDDLSRSLKDNEKESTTKH